VTLAVDSQRAFMSFRKKRLATNSVEGAAETNDESASTGNEIAVTDWRLSGCFDRTNLQTAIEQLPPGYKAMFILHDVHGYEHHEIAKILGCSVGNSKSQLHKARKRLRQELCTEDFGFRMKPESVGSSAFSQTCDVFWSWGFLLSCRLEAG
jgi:RNA polymerase sigma factor (sigma-70 family)